jgi:hypothetical protein
MADDVLLDALDRLRGTGPEFDGFLANHGPMAAEALTRIGGADAVPGWVDAYRPRLQEAPGVVRGIDGDAWREHLGDERLLGDWTDLLRREARDRPWPELLARWWPRLLPGTAASATHGVIRTAHAVRALRGAGADPHPLLVDELAQGLAFWAARFQPLPGAPGSPGRTAPSTRSPPCPGSTPRRPRPGRVSAGGSRRWTGWPGSPPPSTAGVPRTGRTPRSTTSSAPPPASWPPATTRRSPSATPSPPGRGPARAAGPARGAAPAHRGGRLAGGRGDRRGVRVPAPAGGVVPGRGGGRGRARRARRRPRRRARRQAHRGGAAGARADGGRDAAGGGAEVPGAAGA